jgi:hypothetical protein
MTEETRKWISELITASGGTGDFVRRKNNEAGNTQRIRRGIDRRVA